MKTKSFFFIFSVISFSTSCIQQSDILTVIKSDGSCYREYSENADDDFLLGNMSEKHNPFTTTVDSTWDFCWYYKNSGLRTDFPLKKTVLDSIKKLYPSNDKSKFRLSKDEIVVIARRNYKTVEEFDGGLVIKTTTTFSQIKAKHKLNKKFRWFYTYYTYRETYPKLALKLDIPIEKYMAKNEAQFWFTGKPNIFKGMNGLEMKDSLQTLENKYQSWINDNIWAIEFKGLLENFDKLSQKPVSKEQMKNLEDSIYNSKFNNTDNVNLEKTLNAFFNTATFSELWKNENSPMKKYEKDLSGQFIFLFQATFNYKVVLPGKITQASDAIIQGDTLIWKLSSQRLVLSELTLEAESRTVNLWAFILTGIIGVFTVLGYLWKSKRK